MVSEEDRAIARRLQRIHRPATEEGRALAAKLSARLSQVASAPAPGVETLLSLEVSGKLVTAQLRQEKMGQMLGPGCYSEVVVFRGEVRTAMRFPGTEEMFTSGSVVASVFDLLGDRAGEAAERLASLPIAPPSPLVLALGEVRSLENLNLRVDPPDPAPKVAVGGLLDLDLRVFLGPP